MPEMLVLLVSVGGLVVVAILLLLGRARERAVVAFAVKEKGYGEAEVEMALSFFKVRDSLLFVAGLPDRNAQSSGRPERRLATPSSAESPSGRVRAVGPNMEEWTQAKAEGRLCLACNAILKRALDPDEKCPECYARKK